MLAATFVDRAFWDFALLRQYGIGLSIGHACTFRSFIRYTSAELDLSEGALCAGLSNRSWFLYTLI